MSSEMTSAATEAIFTDRPRPTIAPATSSAEASNTMSCPAPKPLGSPRLPWVPPMALAQPPPLTAVVSHGIQALAEMSSAKNATSQPGRRRRVMVGRLADSPLRRCDQRPASLALQRGQVEDDARRVGGPGPPAVGGVLGRLPHRAAVVGDHAQRLVDILGAEENRPIRGDAFGQEAGAVHHAEQ